MRAISKGAPSVRTRRKLAVTLAGGALVAAGIGMTSATYHDQANLNLGNAGIGFPGRFDIALVLPDGTVEQADRAGGYDWAIEDADQLVPGRSITTTLPVFNNTEALAARTTFRVVTRTNDGSVGPGVPNITERLRFEARSSSGVLFTDVPIAKANADLGVLAPRGTGALTEGDEYSTGDEGAAERITLKITFPHAPGDDAFNGGQAALSVRFDAESAQP